MKKEEIIIGDIKITIYNTFDNKTIDIDQDSDKIVLTHKQAIEVSNAFLSFLNNSPIT